MGELEKKRCQNPVKEQEQEKFKITSPISVGSVTFIFPIPDTINDFSIQIDGRLIDWKSISIYGRNFAEIIIDIAANQEIKVQL